MITFRHAYSYMYTIASLSPTEAILCYPGDNVWSPRFELRGGPFLRVPPTFGLRCVRIPVIPRADDA
eukprot:1764989-Prymnesium_polylepis.1